MGDCYKWPKRTRLATVTSKKRGLSFEVPSKALRAAQVLADCVVDQHRESHPDLFAEASEKEIAQIHEDAVEITLLRTFAEGCASVTIVTSESPLFESLKGSGAFSGDGDALCMLSFSGHRNMDLAHNVMDHLPKLHEQILQAAFEDDPAAVMRYTLKKDPIAALGALAALHQSIENDDGIDSETRKQMERELNDGR